LNARVTADDIGEFSRVVEEVLLSRPELERLQATCATASSRYSLEAMVERFADGVVAALDAPRRMSLG
jgi:hypothetical protein